jgi:hypothetical protein
MKKICLGIAAVTSCAGLTCITIVAALALFALSSCVAFLDNVTDSPNVQPTGEAFFESVGGWDYRRIALIEPYQAVSVDGETWEMELRTDSYRYQTSVRVTRLSVISDRYIITYTPNTTLEGERVNELWFIVIPEDDVEVGFTNEEVFLAYLNDIGIGEPGLVDVNELYEELVSRGYLEWFPEEYRE